MKGMRIGFIVFAAALITFGLSGMAFAFHSGGVAECMGCHNIHDAKSTSSLLIASDVTSTCANASCHGSASPGSYHMATSTMGAGVPPGNLTPGGDFGWLLKTYTYSPRSGTTTTEAGERHGHNIVGADLGYVADATNTTAPGGTMDATQFSCNSCHDQHGKLRRLSDGTFATTGAPTIASGSYNNSPVPAAGQAVGAYRLLRGPGSSSGSGGTTFSAVFNAIAPSTYNRSEAVTPTRVAYGAGISDWCATCHPDMHTATSSKMTHPVNQTLGTDVAANYNSYKGSGVTTGITVANSFDSIVPFQRDNLSGIVGYATLQSEAVINGSVSTGPATSDRVMCLSCHRAHASGWEFMGRWNNAGEFMAADGVWPGTDSSSTIAAAPKYSQGRTVAETTAAYDNTTMHYSSYQRSLCNKCHAKD